MGVVENDQRIWDLVHEIFALLSCGNGNSFLARLYIGDIDLDSIRKIESER